MYTWSGEAVVERFPHRWSSCGTSCLESMPFYHAFPDSRCLVIGTAGCNFRCRYCSNAYVAKADPLLQQDRMVHLPPRDLVARAKKLRCRAIVFNVNEPTVSLPSLLEVGAEARAAAIPMGCLTNGYATEEAIELLATVFSFFNISLKGLSPAFGRACLGIESVAPVLRNIRRLAKACHVEVTTPIVPGANDGDIEAMADFLAGVDPEIPWHVLRLLPEDEMQDAENPSIGAIDSALQSARKKLPFLYFHNFVGSDWVDTRCPACKAAVIERISLGCGGDRLKTMRCQDGRCPECGYRIRIFNG